MGFARDTHALLQSCLLHRPLSPTLPSTPTLNPAEPSGEPMMRRYLREAFHGLSYTDTTVAPPSPDYIPGPEDPQTPPVSQDEDEREPRFIQTHDPDFVPEPIYPEYIPLEDEHVFSAEEQPLSPVDSPTAESPGYIFESDPEEDPEEYEDEEAEDGLVDYPMEEGDDGDDDDGDSSGDDADDEDEDEGDEEEEEEEEHLAPADSAARLCCLLLYLPLLSAYMIDIPVMSFHVRCHLTLFVYTDSEPGRAFWGADDEEVSEGGIPRVIVYGYDGLPIQPVAPPSPDYIPGSEDPQTPTVSRTGLSGASLDSYRHLILDFVPEPVYPEYIPLEDEHVFPAEEQPLPPVDSPTAESPGYISESDPEEDPEEYEDEEAKDGPVDYPMDGGDDGDDDDGDSSRDDADDEDEDEGDEEDEEEEEHLAPADSAIVIPTGEPVSPPVGSRINTTKKNRLLVRLRFIFQVTNFSHPNVRYAQKQIDVSERADEHSDRIIEHE
ncbi:hypothetical protein Tco_0009005 [Tanacetum coccineum]